MSLYTDISYTDSSSRRWRVKSSQEGNWIIPPEPSPWMRVTGKDVGEIIDLLQRLDGTIKQQERESDLEAQDRQNSS